MILDDKIYCTISQSLNLDNDYSKIDLLVKTWKQFKNLLEICEQSKKCLSIIFDFRETE